MANLFIVATPIGNLGDITERALRTLSEVDLILAEDTRVTRKLLEHFKIKTPLVSYHQHTKLQKVDEIIDFLKQGKSLALVSDAGTPGVSDPGNKLIEEVARVGLSLNIIPIPGASALTAAASISGFPMDSFLFLGFPPAKKKRKKFFNEVVGSPHPVIFYESPYRIIRTLQDLKATYNSSHGNNSTEVMVVVCRELTKKFETIYRGKIEDVIKEITPKGEFVVVVRRV